MKFTVNDLVSYRTNGVCRIEEIKNCTFGKESGEYYVLRPVYDDKSVIYVPKDSPLSDKICRLLTKSEVDEIIKSLSGEDIDWIENDRERSEHIKDVISSGNKKRIAHFIKVMRHRCAFLAERGKKLRVADESALHCAEKMICDEFSVALGIAREDVSDYIESHIAAATV